MSDHSAIEWTDATWNPTTGCTKVSPACANCYIERTPPFRIAGRKFVHGHIPLEFHDERLTAPLKWRKPRRVFVNSLSDLFHEQVPFEFVDRVFAVMALARQHHFQVLTKRADRMHAYMDLRAKSADYWKRAVPFGYALTWEGHSLVPFPLPNVWLGVSVENQHFADERIPLLLETPAAIRFVSAEPLLESIDFTLCGHRIQGWDEDWRYNVLSGEEWAGPRAEDPERSQHLDWVIVGGESGPRVRPTNPDWVRSIRDQCTANGVKFFFKQWGGATAKAGGRVLDGRTWDELPA